MQAAWANNQSPSSTMTTEFDIRAMLSLMLEIMGQNQTMVMEKMAACYNRRTKERTFKVGGLVLTLLPAGSDKLAAQLYGP